MNITPVAHIESGFKEKFGIPRQSGLVSGTVAHIVFEKEYKNVHLLSNAGHNRFGYVDSLPLDEQERKGLSQQWGMTKAKVISIVLEGFIGLKDNNSVIFDLYSSDSIKCNAEIMGNAVINILKEFSN